MNEDQVEQADKVPALIADECPSCGAIREGWYCAVCGERRLKPGDRRLRALFAAAFSTVFDADGRLPRSLAAMLFRPGLLTSEWMNGRRRLWLGPVSLYLLINLLIFIAPPLTDFNLSLREQTELQFWSDSAAELVDTRIAERESDFATEADLYGDVSSEVGKLLLIWHVPFLAFAVAIVSGWKRHYAADYLVWSLHQFTVFLVMISSVAWTVAPLFHWMLPREQAIEALALTWSGLLLVFSVHSIFAAHRAFCPSRWRSVLFGPVLLVAIGLGHASYRLVQFLVAFALS